MTEIYLFKKKKNFPYFFHFTKEIYESLHVCKWKKKRKKKAQTEWFKGSAALESFLEVH